MILPMERSEVFKILSDIFRQKDNMNKTPLGNIMMSESVGNPCDIDFRCEYTGTMVGYLRIVNPPKDCVDGEYCFVYHVPKTQKASTIAIDAFGNIRVYGDDIDSFIYKAIKDNANQLADYVKKLTRTYHEQVQVADVVIYSVKTYCETLINEHASDFDQMDMSVSEGVCTEFLIRSINEPERNHQFDVVKHIYDYSINDNDIWVRFSKPYDWLWTPLVIKPSIGDIVINTEQCVFTNIFGAKEMVRLARLISDQTGFAISVRDGGSTRDKNIAKYIKSLLQKHEVIDTVKQASTERDDFLSCDDVFQVVVDWLHSMSSCGRIKDVRNIRPLHHTLSVSNSIGCGASKQYVTEELKVSFTPYMKTMMISLGKEHIITIDDLGLGDKSTCVYIVKYNQRGIDDVLNKYLVACLAEVLKDRLGMDKLRAYTTVKCTQYTELIHCGSCFFNDDGKTAYAIDPECVISKEKIDKMNDESNNTIKSIVDDVVDKKLDKFVKTGSMCFTTKDFLCSKIFEQLSLWQQGIFHMIYSAIYCTLAESKYTGAAFELEHRFMELVGMYKDLVFHVYLRLDDIHKDLPRFDIVFDQSDILVRIQEGDFTKPCVLLNRETDHAKVYTQNIKYMRDTYKTIASHVASKIVLMDALS